MGERTCSVENCDSPANVPGSARGMCGKHYQRWKKHGDPLHKRPVVVGVAACSIAECMEIVKARGWCVKHWTRWQRFGDPEARLLGEVRNGKRICPTCKVDTPLDKWSGGECKQCGAFRARTRRTDPAVQESIRAYNEQWREQNPDYHKARTKDWRLRNPDQVRVHRMERRARLAGAAVESFTPQEIYDRDGWICGLCGEAIPRSAVYPDPRSVSLDHIVPLARQGTHERANCQAAHLVCNVRKGARRIA